LYSPEGVTVDASGNLFIADTDNQRIREVGTNGIITLVAGNGSAGYSGDGGAATNASLYNPEGVTVDASGNLFIADTDNLRIRKVGTNGIITTEAGDGSFGYSGDGGPATNGNFYYPRGVAVDASDNLFIADTDNQRIREVIVSSPNLSLSPLTLNNAGNYSVIVSSPYGSVTSSVAALTLSIPPSVVPLQSQNQTVVAGSNVTLDVAITGTGPFSCQWQYDGSNLVGSSGASLTLTGVGTTNAGTYAIAVFSPSGSVTSMVAQLTVLSFLSPPVIATQPTNLVSVQGGNATFTVAVSGTGPFNYQWYGNGAVLPPMIATVAGGSIVDGVSATNANLFNPYGSAVDAFGNLFIADSSNHRIRKVGTNGIITTVAGNGAPGCYGDGGAAINASLDYPHGVAADASGNLFIADTDNYRIRKVGTNDIITTVAGSGAYGYAGDGGEATNASMTYPYGVAVDAIGNLFIADVYNYCIREVGTNGIITTVAGNGNYGYSGDGGPATNATMTYPYDVAVDANGNLFIADQNNNCIRKVGTNGIITTAAGDGSYGYSGDGGAATNASMTYPYSVAVDAIGNLFIADVFNYRIREVGTNGIIATVAGDGSYGYAGDGSLATSASMTYPYGVAVDNLGDLFIADFNNQRIRRVGTNGIITTVAGDGSTGFPGDGGAASDAHLSLPSGVAVDAVGNLFIADTDNARIRKAGTNGIINTIAGTGRNGYSGDGAAATAASLEYPCGVAVDGVGDLFIADEDNQRLREVGLTGIITTIAGNGGFGYSGDSVALGPNASLADPYGTAVDAYGNVFIADTANNCIRRIAFNGIIYTVAGNGAAGYSGDGGAATNASLDYPEGVAVDAAGNLFIADTDNQRIRKVGTNGIITTVAGNGFGGYSGDEGPATSASLNYPQGVAVDASSNLFIADCDNHRIRMVAPNGVISSLAGCGIAGFFGDGGPATNASLAYPAGVATDASGNLLVADGENNRVRKIWLAGQPALTLNNLTPNDAGNYYVVIKGPYGSVTSSVVYLAITGMPPTITEELGNLSVSSGANASLSVSATGGGPLTYQWQLNGTNIPGATSSKLSLTNVLTTGAGVYTVLVTGPGGTASDSALLTVGPTLSIFQNGSQIILGWSGPWVLQTATNVSGPYSDLPGATSPFTNMITAEPWEFFRLRSTATNYLAGLGLSTNGFLLSGSGAPGYNYVIEASTNLVNWTPVETNPAPFQFIDIAASNYPVRFYRTVLIH